MSGSATVAASLRQAERVPRKSSDPIRPIRICHFTTAHRSLKSRSFHRQCLPLSQAGADVRYVTPTTKADDDISFVSVPCPKGRFRRALANPNLFRALIRQDADLYHFQDPELLPLALALKIAFGKRMIYDAYEDFPSMVRASLRIPRPLRQFAGKMTEALESLAARCFDGITTADPLTMRRFSRIGKSRKLVFHNFPNLDFFPAPRAAAKRFDVVYRGGISERAGTLVLLDAVRILVTHSRSPRLLLLGYFDNPAAEQNIRNCIRDRGLESFVEIRGPIDHEEMASSLSQARIGVCPLQRVPKFLMNIPVKVFEYWACGLPVVASDLPPIRPYFHSAAAGLLFEPGNATGMAHSIEWMLDHPACAQQMGENGRVAVVQRFNNHAEIHKLERLCMQLVSGSETREEVLARA